MRLQQQQPNPQLPLTAPQQAMSPAHQQAMSPMSPQSQQMRSPVSCASSPPVVSAAMQQQQQQQQQQQRPIGAEQQRQMALKQLQMEKERLAKRQEEINRQVGDQVCENPQGFLYTISLLFYFIYRFYKKLNLGISIALLGGSRR
jgi:hypothetical protein